MWRFQSKHNPLRDQLLLAAPETNPHEFVRRYLRAKPQPSVVPRPFSRLQRPLQIQ